MTLRIYEVHVGSASFQIAMFIICKHNYIWLQIPTAALLVSTGLYIRRYRASWAYGFRKAHVAVLARYAPLLVPSLQPAHGHGPSRKGFELRGWAESRGCCTCSVLLALPRGSALQERGKSIFNQHRVSSVGGESGYCAAVSTLTHGGMFSIFISSF